MESLKQPTYSTLKEILGHLGSIIGSIALGFGFFYGIGEILKELI